MITFAMFVSFLLTSNHNPAILLEACNSIFDKITHSVLLQLIDI